MILHIDCNTFYASCEVALRPDLKGKPVAVANCNEAGGGIILALTKEAKALGLKRGDPVFKVKEILNRNNVAVFPSNLYKYVDISRRIMQIVKEMDLVVNFKQYSVDEFFAELPLSSKDDLRQYALKIKRQIEKCSGIPVSCGVSLSYTLAKIATWYSKRFNGYGGVCVLERENIEKALERIKIGDVWGIGRRTAPKLESHRIETALDFFRLPEYRVRHYMNVNGVRTWKELHGTPSVSIDNPPRQKQIAHCRTFTYMTSDLAKLHSCIADYAFAASRKLRDQHSLCQTVSVFIATNPHREDLAQFQNFGTTTLDIATADVCAIAKAASSVLDRIFLPYYQYKSAGIILGEIIPSEAIQLDIFNSDCEKISRSIRLMEALDSLTTKYGMHSVQLAAQGFEKEGMNLTNFQPMRNETTNINEILCVR